MSQLAGAEQGRESLIQEHERAINVERSARISSTTTIRCCTGRVSELENELAVLSERLYQHIRRLGDSQHTCSTCIARELGPVAGTQSVARVRELEARVQN